MTDLVISKVKTLTAFRCINFRKVAVIFKILKAIGKVSPCEYG